MTDRDRLLELVDKAKEEYANDITDHTETDYIVETLLNEGVIVSPCKVGDKVYYPYDYGNKVLEKTVKRIVIENNDKWLDVGVSFLPFENIGKTVFLTKEEAEQKLKEREG